MVMGFIMNVVFRDKSKTAQPENKEPDNTGDRNYPAQDVAAMRVRRERGCPPSMG